MPSRRTLIVAIAAALLVAVLLWRARAPRSAETRAQAAASAAAVDPVPGEPLAPAPLPPPQGALTIRGEVRGPAGPVAGAVVTATTARGEDVLSELGCHCGNDCGQKLLECGCGEAAGQLLELVAQRRGETPPVARATTGADGRFTLEGLADGSYGVWAESEAGAGIVQGIRPGAGTVVVDVDGGVRISGKVLGEDGKGVARAVVTAIYAPHSRFFDTLSGADGAFSFGPLPAGPYTVVASSSGLLPARARVDRGAAGKVRLELVAPRLLAGRVTLGGVPAEGASVALRGEHRKAEVRTDADGAFAFRALRAGEYQLLAALGDRAAQGTVTIPRRRDVRDVTLALTAGVTVDGTVVDDAGAPVPGARVTVDQLAPRRRDRIATARADPAGRFRVGPLEPGELELSASHEGYVTATEDDLRVAALESRSVTLVLRRARPIEGRVVDPEGKPVSGAVVVGTPRAAGPDEGGETSARSGDDGSFTLDVRGGGYTLEVSHELFRRGKVTTDAPARGIVVTLQRGAGVEGDVLDEDGKPVAGAAVMILSATAGAPRDPEARSAATDGRGRFRLGGLDPGPVHVLAHRAPDERSATAHARVEVPAEGTAQVRLRFEAGLALGGTVVGPDGAAVAGVKVWVRSTRRPSVEGDPRALLAALSQGQAETDAAGRFTVRGLAAGEHLVTAGKEGFLQPVPPPRFRAGDADVRIVLARRGAVRGRVVGDAGAPLAGARVNGIAGEEGDGRFSVPIGADGPLTLTFTADGYAPAERTVEVSRGADLELGEVVLGRGREVTGVVVDAASGAPVAAARVSLARDALPGLLDRQDRGAETAITGRDGTFAVRNAPDRVQLRVEADGYAPVTVPVAAGQGAVSVRLGRGGAIAVRVLRAAGDPMARTEVAAFTRDGTHQSGKTDADGRWEAKALPPGRYLVFVNADRANPGLAGRQVDVADGERAQVELQERAEGATLAVTLTGPGARVDEELHVALVRGELPPVAGFRDLAALGVPIEPVANQPALSPIFQLLEPGRYTLLVAKETGGGFGLLARPVEVGTAPQQRLEVQVPAELPIVKY